MAKTLRDGSNMSRQLCWSDYFSHFLCKRQNNTKQFPLQVHLHPIATLLDATVPMLEAEAPLQAGRKT